MGLYWGLVDPAWPVAGIALYTLLLWYWAQYSAQTCDPACMQALYQYGWTT